ncbi:MAG TPA: hypothetical protein PKZ44_10790 [Flavobacterium sp.]|nr:hypothetical protein [Flavobacterium sp.]
MKNLGVTFLIISFIMISALINPNYGHSINKTGSRIAFVITLGFLIGGFYLYRKGMQRNNIKKNTAIQQKFEQDNELKQYERKRFEDRISQLESLKLRMEELNSIHIVEISDYKSFIKENQKAILQKGNDEVLFSFLKIDSFLNEYKQGMESYKNWVIKNIDVEDLKSKLIQDFQSNNLDKLSEGLQANFNRLEGKRPTGFNASFDNLLSVGHVFKGTYENYNKTLEYYKNIAKTMIIFYLNDNKISYFEIHQAFEKLGVFDSTWQKNLMSKMSNIESNLNRISLDLTQMNSNFEQLINQSEKITNELQAINNSVKTGNMIQAISAYQSWRINRKINK